MLARLAPREQEARFAALERDGRAAGFATFPDDLTIFADPLAAAPTPPGAPPARP